MHAPCGSSQGQDSITSVNLLTSLNLHGEYLHFSVNMWELESNKFVTVRKKNTDNQRENLASVPVGGTRRNCRLLGGTSSLRSRCMVALFHTGVLQLLAGYWHAADSHSPVFQRMTQQGDRILQKHLQREKGPVQ